MERQIKGFVAALPVKQVAILVLGSTAIWMTFSAGRGLGRDAIQGPVDGQAGVETTVFGTHPQIRHRYSRVDGTLDWREQDELR